MNIFKLVGLLKIYCTSCIAMHCLPANKYFLKLFCMLDHYLDMGKISSNNKMSPISTSLHSSVRDNEPVVDYQQYIFLW